MEDQEFAAFLKDHEMLSVDAVYVSDVRKALEAQDVPSSAWVNAALQDYTQEQWLFEIAIHLEKPDEEKSQ